MPWQRNPVARLMELAQQEKKLIYTIYFYAILVGIIQLTLPIGIQSIINFVMAGSFSMSLALLITLVVGGVFITGMLHVNQMKVIESIQQRIFVRYSYAVSERLPRIDLKKADGSYLPELVNRFFEIPKLQKSLSKILLDLPVALIQILFGLILLSFYHSSFILFGFLLLVLLWLMIRVTGRKGLETSFATSAAKYRLVSWMEDVARMVKTFKFSRGSEIHLKKADERTTAYLKAKTDHFRIMLFQYKGLVLFKTIITAAMLIVGSYLLLDQKLNIGQFIAAEIVIIMILAAVEKIISHLDSVYSILTSLDKVAKIAEKETEEYGNIQSDHRDNMNVVFNEVNFAYEAGRQVLTNVSFRVNPGEKVCLTGREGSGKSSILKLLTGSYLDFDGAILVDGVPLRNHDVSYLRHHTGAFLNQQEIFEGSLLENITMGNDDVKLEDVMALAEMVGLTEFLAKQKDGLHTQLDTTGKRLPGSVMHKILLVRALVKQPRLIIMDEPFLRLEEPYRTRLKQYLLQQTPATVILTTADKEFAAACHQTIHLN